MTTAFLGLGANLGDPVQNIIDARNQLYAMSEVQQGRCSSLYLTSPVGYTDQPDFINCVVQLTGDIELQALFSSLQSIENSLGRQRDPGNRDAARMIDIDLLVFDDLILESNDLVIPHPRLHERLFVLQPLVELAPDLMIGKLGTAQQLMINGNFENQQVFKLGN